MLILTYRIHNDNEQECNDVTYQRSGVITNNLITLQAFPPEYKFVLDYTVLVLRMAHRIWKKLSSTQAQLGQTTCLAVAYFLSISFGPS